MSEEIPLLAVGDLKYERIKLLDPRYRFSYFPKLINSSTFCPVVPFVTLALVVYMLPLCLKTSKMAVVDDVTVMTSVDADKGMLATCSHFLINAVVFNQTEDQKTM